MLDEKDLQAIQKMMQEMIQESEERMTGKIAESEERMTGKIAESEERMTGKIEESERRMMGKIEETASQTLKDALQGASVLMESKFKLLFENQQTMMETLAPKSRVEELEEEVTFLRSVVRQHSREIEALKHA